MMITQPIIDPKSGAKRDYNKKTLIDHFEEFGLFFKPKHINLEARIYRLNNYFMARRIEIFEDKCQGLIKELRNYKYPDRTLGNRKQSMKPVDKNNHGINALEWITMELPAEPKKLQYGVYNRDGVNVNKRDDEAEARDRPYIPFALKDELDYTTDMQDFRF